VVTVRLWRILQKAPFSLPFTANGSDSFGFQPRGRKVHQVYETSLKVRASSIGSRSSKISKLFLSNSGQPLSLI
jgi:hypothetical protein